MASQPRFINDVDDRRLIGGHPFAVEVSDVATCELKIIIRPSEEVCLEVEVACVVMSADGPLVREV